MAKATNPFYVGLLVLALALIPISASVCRAAPPDPPDGAPDASDSAFYQQIVAAYLAGKWDDVAADLKDHATEIAALPKPQAADIAYVQQTLKECRPDWLERSKAGKKFLFGTMLWGRALNATYDPAGNGVKTFSSGGITSLTVSWNYKDLDSPAQAEHGYTKGELANLSIWMTMGMGQAYSNLPMSAYMVNDQAGKNALYRYLDFRGDVTGTYYAIPRGRRWGFWLCLAANMDRYSKEPNAASRQAVGDMFVAEIVGHRAAYPSIRLPDSVPADGTEKFLALHLKDWIEGHGWTLAEDRSIRDAVKAFAKANDQELFQTLTVKLPNGLVVYLDPKRDASNRPKRDAWLKSRLDQPADSGN